MSGEGSIFKRASTGRWVAQLSIGSRGSRRYVTRLARTRAEARLALDELRAEHRAGLRPSRMTVGDYLERWVADARNIRDTTRDGYRAVVTYHLAPTIGGVQLADLSPLHVERALAQLAGSMSPKSLRNVHAVLRRALGQAVRAGLLSRNVASREFVDAPRVTSDEPDAFSADEVTRLVAAAAGDPIEPLVVTALGTGLRLGELLGLAWEDVESASLTVRYELARVDGTYRRVEPKTPRSRRRVPLAPAVVDVLRRHRERLVADGFLPTATGPVFVNRTGGPLNGSWVTHRLYRIEEGAGIRRLPFKALRATFGTRLFDAGVPDRQIRDLLGHTRERTTHRHYISTEGASQDAAVEAIERLIG